MDTLKLQPGQDHLERVAKTADPLRGIAELVWNSLDGDCDEVAVEFEKNPLGGLQIIRVRDNGTGIRPDALRKEFGQLGESWKKNATRTPKHGRAMHGKEGRGRLRFFSIAGSAFWLSTYASKDGFERVTASISAASLSRVDISSSPVDGVADTGTTVELSQLKDTFDWLTGTEAFQLFSATFAPYVLQYPTVRIFYDGKVIDPSLSVTRTVDIPFGPLMDIPAVASDLRLKVIEWHGQTGDRRIYLGTDEGISLASQAAGITAPGFSFSAYAYSGFFEKMQQGNLLELAELTDPDLGKVLDVIREALRDYFRDRQAQESSNVIADLIAEGAYPYQGEPSNEIENRERQLFDIATYAVSSYSREFKRADTSIRRMTLALLREAVRHNPESITNILRAVINLPKNRQDEFSDLLDRTELSNIISASSLIAERVIALQVIREMVSDPDRRLSVKERGELDLLVQANTWIFGEQFHISLAEAGLTRVMDRVARDLGTRRKGKVRKPDGSAGRADAFLGRVIPHPQQEHREYLLIELKRPKTAVGRREFDQIEDYAKTLIAQPEYKDTSTVWNFFLITTDIEEDSIHRVTQNDRPPGLFLDLHRAKVWVKRWGEVLRVAEARLQFVQDHLKVEVTNEDIDARVEALKSSILRQRSASSEAA